MRLLCFVLFHACLFLYLTDTVLRLTPCPGCNNHIQPAYMQPHHRLPMRSHPHRCTQHYLYNLRNRILWSLHTYMSGHLLYTDLGYKQYLWHSNHRHCPNLWPNQLTPSAYPHLHRSPQYNLHSGRRIFYVLLRPSLGLRIPPRNNCRPDMLRIQRQYLDSMFLPCRLLLGYLTMMP